jgi:glycosyltransferase involved in cell wall biosynthesis
MLDQTLRGRKARPFRAARAEATLNEPSGEAKPRVAVVSFPWKSDSPYKFLSDLITILEPISDKIVVIDGNTDRIDTAHCSKVVVRDIGIGMHYLGDMKPKYRSAVVWMLKWLLIQYRASVELARLRTGVDVVIFYVAYPGFLLPLVVTKLLRKKSIEIVTRSEATTTTARLWGLQDPILFTLLDGISPESRGLIQKLDLEKYRQKILPEGARFIDDRLYKKNKSLSERANVVGFIGRMTREKGIVDFVHAIPLAAEEGSDLKFSIVGSGPLSDWVNEQCNRLSTEWGIDITLTNWVETGLVDYYNELKLLVVPTYLDAFPTSILEAMACGTPVLATSVGAIPDVIADEDTGFLLESTAPECIARRITTILNHRKLEEIAENAEDLIRQKFTRATATERYDRMLKEVFLDTQRPEVWP